MVKRSAFLFAASFAWACAAASAPHLPPVPGVGPVDRRVPVDMSRPPWAALVRVQTELGERCTGFVVAPRVVVTAAHCLFLPKVGGFIQPRSVHVLLAYDAGRYAGHAQVVRFTIPDGYRPLDEAATAGLDRAVLVLDHRLLPAAAVLGVAAAPSALPAPALLGGYGQDRDEVAIAEPGCHVLAEMRDAQGRRLLAHDCQATRGTSGAPLLWRRPDGHWAAIGIQIEARAASGGVAVPLLGPDAPTPADSSADSRPGSVVPAVPATPSSHMPPIPGSPSG